jgi:hypothetical protein
VLGELGADVIEVEPLPTGDKLRWLVRAGTGFSGDLQPQRTSLWALQAGLPAELPIRRASAAASEGAAATTRRARLPRGSYAPVPHLPQVTGLAPFNIVSKGVASARVVAIATTA